MDANHISARLKARQDQLRHEQKRKLAHGKVAALLRGQKARASVVEYAVLQVAKWRQNGLCSADYIDEWAALLSDPEQAAKVLVEDSPRAVRLRQNTPFAAYLSR